MGLIAVFTVLLLSFYLASGLPERRVPDTFDGLSVYLPGRSAKNLDRLTSCHEYRELPGTYHYYYLSCSLDHDQFSLATMTLPDDSSVIQAVTFLARPAALQIGDLMILFPVHSRVRMIGASKIIWDGGYAASYIRMNSIFTPYTYVSSVRITQNG